MTVGDQPDVPSAASGALPAGHPAARTADPARTAEAAERSGQDDAASAAELDDLAEAVRGLSQLAVGAHSLEHALTWIARWAAVAVPGADGAGVTMLEAGHPRTVCVSSPFVQEIDDIQYRLEEGPCITAATEARTVVSGSLGSERSWPRFGPRARDLGIHSALSLPLLMGDGEVVGAINVYAHDRDAFTPAAALVGADFAAPAAVAVHNAREFMQARRLAAQLQAALGSRAVIDQAIGILMSRQGGTAEEAFARLRRTSQRDNVKLTAVAQQIVDEAVRRARARHARS